MAGNIMYVTYKGVTFPEQKHYEDVRFNVISITRGWVGIKFPEKKALRKAWTAHYSIQSTTYDDDNADINSLVDACLQHQRVLEVDACDLDLRLTIVDNGRHK